MYDEQRKRKLQHVLAAGDIVYGQWSQGPSQRQDAAEDKVRATEAPPPHVDALPGLQGVCGELRGAQQRRVRAVSGIRNKSI